MREESLGFSDFRYWLDIWDEAVDKEQLKNKVRSIIEGDQLVFFFSKGKGIYGAPEMSRVTFAKLKEPDEDVPPGWAEEADFSAIDLKSIVRGEKTESLFGLKDLNGIKIIDADDVYDKITKED